MKKPKVSNLKHLVLEDAIRRCAKYSVHYVDYSEDTWTVPEKLTVERRDMTLNDNSIDKIRIEFDL